MDLILMDIDGAINRSASDGKTNLGSDHDGEYGLNTRLDEARCDGHNLGVYLHLHLYMQDASL